MAYENFCVYIKENIQELIDQGIDDTVISYSGIDADTTSSEERERQRLKAEQSQMESDDDVDCYGESESEEEPQPGALWRGSARSKE